MSDNETPQDVTPTDTELVRAVQAQPPDDAQRARAVNDLRSAVDADDYYAVGQAGALGPVEL